MRAISLRLQHFRNFAHLEVALHPKLTLICGENGSGKTSLLEALYYLIYGRSFRTHLISRLVQHTATNFTLAAQFTTTLRTLALGLERNVSGYRVLKYDGALLTSHTPLIQTFPLQLLDHDSYLLLAGGSKYRRELLDRGLFHVKPEFLEVWRRYMKSLQHRNRALREHARLDYIKMWDQELVAHGELLANLRRGYLLPLIPRVNDLLQQLDFPYKVEINYLPGWSQADTFAENLIAHLKDDLNRGHTTTGPHHADIAITINGVPVKDFLSRGQQKILIYALQIAETQLLHDQTGAETLTLIDDLLAELDQFWAQKFVGLILKQPQLQLVFTAMSCESLQNWLVGEYQTIMLNNVV